MHHEAKPIAATPAAPIAMAPLPAVKAAAALTRRDWLIALAVALAVILTRALLSDHRGFWLDEYFTLRAARMNFPELIQDRIRAGHSPLYFFYARLGFMFGREEWMLRFSSGLAAGVAVLMLTGLAGAVGLRFCLPAFWGLSLILPYWITAGTEYRYMMPVIALTGACGWAAATYARQTAPGRGVALAALLGLLLWTHGSAQFVSLGLLAFLLWEFRVQAGGWSRTVFFRSWPVLAGILLSVPLLALIRGGRSGLNRRLEPDMGSLIGELCESVFGNTHLWPRFFGWKNMNQLIQGPAVILLLAAIWLTARELRRRGRGTALRLLLALALGIPLTQHLLAILGRQTQGLVRYVAAFSVPALLILAVAWHADFNPRLKWFFRALLAALLLVQAAGTALDRGDLHREAIRWLIANQHGEKLLVSSGRINVYALGYLDYPRLDRVTGLAGKSGRVKAGSARNQLTKAFENERRGFVLLYHDGPKIHRLIAELQRTGFILNSRRIAVSDKVLIIALIRDPAEQAWLKALPPFERPWGPAKGDGRSYDPKEKPLPERSPIDQ